VPLLHLLEDLESLVEVNQLQVLEEAANQAMVEAANPEVQALVVQVLEHPRVHQDALRQPDLLDFVAAKKQSLVAALAAAAPWVKVVHPPWAHNLGRHAGQG